MKNCKYWDYNGIKHLAICAGFVPSTVCFMDKNGIKVVYWPYEGQTLVLL
jgi:hypothetical protein